MEGRRVFFLVHSIVFDFFEGGASMSSFPAPVFSLCRSFSSFLLLTRGARDRAEREHEEGEGGAHRELLIQSGFFKLSCAVDFAPFSFFSKSRRNRRRKKK